MPARLVGRPRPWRVREKFRAVCSAAPWMRATLRATLAGLAEPHCTAAAQQGESH